MITASTCKASIAALGLAVSLLLGSSAAGDPIKPLPEKVPCVIADKQDAQVPDRVQLSGWLGTRIAASERNRLVAIDTDRLLEGYRKRPGRQTWDGEHVGKWLHAATLAWANSGDPALRAKLDRTVTELCKCQLADGYLGTYAETERWTEWDVWAHKYNLIGLITYMRHTGNQEPLPTCRKMADLLCATFGDGPGKRNILKAGEHVGMAPTSVLEPMVLLYRLTGEKRYLEFSESIVCAWETPGGPQIVSRLLDGKGVDKVGNAKAYEMLSCLNGALELYRTNGDRNLLDASLKAWQDIVDRRLYITGAASYGELFGKDFDLPNTSNVGETCVTVTWMQLNAQLLRLTGEARFAERLEQVALNQLLGAQRPDGCAWGYYVQMEGTKPYSDSLDGHCCLSSGPRGIALLPTFAITTDEAGVVINFFDAGAANLALRDGTPVTVKLESLYPSDGRVRITIDPASPREFAVKVRIPEWCVQSSIKPFTGERGADGYTAIRRTWTRGDALELDLPLTTRVVVGDHLNAGKAAVLHGPLVLAADESLMAEGDPPLRTLALSGTELAALALKPEPAPADRATWPGAQWYRVNAGGASAPRTVRLVPFADAGATSRRYKVWLPLAGQTQGSLLLAGVESRSRQGNVTGSILDGDGFVVTFDGKRPASNEDWFAVTLPAPIEARRFVFTHGKNFHDGGWFDTSSGKPRVQVQRVAGGEWETIGELAEYPATTATKGDHERLTWSNRRFTLALEDPVRFTAVRVIGVPASGDNPAQAFSSCAGLEAFEK